MAPARRSAVRAPNECPEPELHCGSSIVNGKPSTAREITSLSGDVIECCVAKPPRDRESAIRLAWQHYMYCMDIVEQGCESVSQLAGILLNSPYWYFWWD